MSLIQKRTSKSFAIVLVVAMVLAMLPTMAFATDFDNDHDSISIATGEPVYVEWDSTTSLTGTVTPVDSSYYPNSFILYAQNTDGAPTSDNATITYLYDTEGGKAYKVNLSDATTISITLLDSVAGGNTTYTLSCSAPVGTAPDSTKPSAVNGYLPIGQFARGNGWGAICTDGTNTGAEKKFINGYESTGVSLGAAGGYVDFDMNIENSELNPYGIDFTVYGNPFNGNPEAGSVKVFGYTSGNDQTGEWYELAGSLYYDNVTERNKDVSYKKASDGIYYQITNNGVAPFDNNWKKFTSDTNWWSDDDEGYNNVWGPVDDVTRTSDIVTYKNVSIVKDTDATNDYQFGYFDIRSNGSNYGTAVNPYATAPTANAGGDGFDLDWAVDANGNPVALDHAAKVRVYTSAAMKADGSGIFTTPSIFGETSAEVCGIYATKPVASNVEVTAMPEFVIGGCTLSDFEDMGAKIDFEEVSDNNLVFSIEGIYDFIGTGVFDVEALTDASNVVIKDVRGQIKEIILNDDETGTARIIVQDGEKIPFILTLRFL